MININWKPWIGGAGLLSAGIAVVASLYAIVTHDLGTEVKLPVLAIGGVIALLVVIAMVAGAFKLFDLADGQEALGLPEGSVRAIIALSLIVLFAILTIYLYSTVSHPQLQHSPELTGTERDAFLRNIRPERVIVTVSNGKATAEERFTVYYNDGSSAGEDFAKQLLVMIGTLMTSVTSFYFAAKSSPPSVPLPGPKPVLRAISPKAAPRGKSVDLEITGDNLNLAKDVKLTQGSHQVVATSPVSNANVLKCTVLISGTEPEGAWTVVVTDSSGQSAELAGAITFTDPPPA